MAITQVTKSVEFVQVLRWNFVTGMLVHFSVAVIEVTVPVAIMQLEVFAAHTQVTVAAANMWVTIFVVIMQMEVYVAITQVLQLRRYFLQCNMHMTVSVVIYILLYAGEPFFYSHVGDGFKVEIIYKMVTRVIQYFYFPDKPMKVGDILDF